MYAARDEAAASADQAALSSDDAAASALNAASSADAAENARDEALELIGSAAKIPDEVSADELGFLDGVNSSIQTQLNNRLSLQGGTMQGVLQMPYQPFFRGKLGGDTGTDYYPTLVTYGSEGVTVNAAASRITVSAAGLYNVHVHQLVSTTNTIAYLCIRVNGGTILHAYADHDSTYDLSVSALVELEANDYVEFFYDGTVTAAWTGPHSSVFLFMTG